MTLPPGSVQAEAFSSYNLHIWTCYKSVLNPYAAGAQFDYYKMIQKTYKMTETLAHGHSFESTQQELSNEYQHDRVKMVFKSLCVLVLWAKVASALEGLTHLCP